MGSRGICKNCEREMAIVADGMCGACCRRAAGLADAEREVALAKAKEDFKGKGPMHGPYATRKTKVEEKPKKDPPSGAIAPVAVQDIGAKVEEAAPGAVPFCSIVVTFSAEDHAIYNGLLALSRKYRRTPEQQIMWLLQGELIDECLLALDEKEAAHGIDAQAS